MYLYDVMRLMVIHNGDFEGFTKEKSLTKMVAKGMGTIIALFGSFQAKVVSCGFVSSWGYRDCPN